VAFDLLWLERCRPAPFASQRAPAAPAEHSAERLGGDRRSALGSGPRARTLRAHARSLIAKSGGAVPRPQRAAAAVAPGD
jgi:hypothetical protein